MSTQENIRYTFAEAAVEEAARIANRASAVLAGRSEVRGITIDGPTSKDLDDAFWFEKNAQGGYTLEVSIADTGSLITPQQTPNLEQAAFSRAFTRYHASGNHPMLPRTISEGCLSLLEGQARPTITASIPFDSHLHPGEPQIALTWIRSRKRLSYSEVDDELAHPRSELAPMLHLAYTFALGQLHRRKQKGALAIYDIAAGWATTEEGILRPLGAEEKYKAQIITHELMFLANLSFANFLSQQGIPALYRNHTARAIAPERFRLLEMLDAALADPDRLHPERLKGTINLALERAKYAPTVEGHFGLNLPVYTHMTSPLRRYPDLLNQQILLAALQGTPLPYTSEELATFASHINNEERDIKDAKSTHFRTIHETRVQVTTSTSSQDLTQIDVKTFHTLIRLAAEKDELVPAVEQEIYRRLELQLLEVHDLFTLVFRFKNNGDRWQNVKKAVLQGIQQKPEQAVSLLYMGHQSLNWGKPRFESSFEGADHARVFQASVHITRAKSHYHSSLHTASQKDRAKQLASAELLAQLAGIELVPMLTTTSPKPPVDPLPVVEPRRVQARSPQTLTPAELQNAKGKLQEVIQASKWDPVSYTVLEQAGPPHAPIFMVEANIRIQELDYRTQGQGSTKIEAEQRAARALLPLLPRPLVHTPGSTDQAEKNAVSILHELKQQSKIRDVTYSYHSADLQNQGAFRCICIILRLDGKSIEGDGSGTTKKVAAQIAASQALEALSIH